MGRGTSSPEWCSSLQHLFGTQICILNLYLTIVVYSSIIYIIKQHNLSTEILLFIGSENETKSSRENLQKGMQCL